jgi:hypothetical protein
VSGLRRSRRLAVSHSNKEEKEEESESSDEGERDHGDKEDDSKLVRSAMRKRPLASTAAASASNRRRRSPSTSEEEEEESSDDDGSNNSSNGMDKTKDIVSENQTITTTIITTDGSGGDGCRPMDDGGGSSVTVSQSSQENAVLPSHTPSQTPTDTPTPSHSTNEEINYTICHTTPEMKQHELQQHKQSEGNTIRNPLHGEAESKNMTPPTVQATPNISWNPAGLHPQFGPTGHAPYPPIYNKLHPIAGYTHQHQLATPNYPYQMHYWSSPSGDVPQGHHPSSHHIPRNWLPPGQTGGKMEGKMMPYYNQSDQLHLHGGVAFPPQSTGVHSHGDRSLAYGFEPPHPSLVPPHMWQQPQIPHHAPFHPLVPHPHLAPQGLWAYPHGAGHAHHLAMGRQQATPIDRHKLSENQKQ